MKKMVAAVLTTLLVATSASAVVDPDTDSIGIYLDQTADTFCGMPGAVGAYDVYLCATNVSATSGVSGWECNVEVTAGVFVLAWTFSGQAINASSAPDFAVGLASPLPWAPSIVLMTITVGLFTPDPVEFFIHPANVSSFDPPLPGYATGDDPGDLRTLGYSSGSSDLPVCQLNMDCQVVSEDNSTWGGVKGLYR